MSNSWINVVTVDGKDRLVKRNEALELIRQGAEFAGDKDGRTCIVQTLTGEAQGTWRPTAARGYGDAADYANATGRRGRGGLGMRSLQFVRA